MTISSYKIALVGLWHLGEIYSAGLSQLGHRVLGISDDEKVVTNLSQGIPPLPEPQLEELISQNCSSGRLRYSTNFKEIENCNVLWFTFDTPVNDDDDVDLSSFWEALDKSLPYLQDGMLILVSSQIPVGTSKKIKEFISKNKPGLSFEYAYAPENLRLGEAVKCFFEAERIVIGADSEIAFQRAEEIFSGLKAEILKMSSASAEVSKHALNAFLATSISFINEMADICEKAGADILDVSKALRLDSRIGARAFLDAGLGFSGGTLGRDLRALINFSKERGFSLPVVENVFKKNQDRKDLVRQRLLEAMGDLGGKTISVFGLTYKPGTRTLRRSRALEIVSDLSSQGAILHLYDPAVQKEELPLINNSTFYNNPYEAAQGSDALIFITPWPEFRKLDFKNLFKNLKPQALLFDTSNLFSDKEKEIQNWGLKYLSIGRWL